MDGINPATQEVSGLAQSRTVRRWLALVGSRLKPNYLDFFLAIAGASGALIGLLFVAISVAPERVVGPKARELHQADHRRR